MAASLEAAAPAGVGHDITRAKLPPHALAVMEALRLDGAGNGRLAALDDEEYRKALDFCDRTQLTLLLNHLCRDALPAWMQARIDGNRRSYSERFDRLKRALSEIADGLESHGIEFVVLKGLTHAPAFTPEALLRAQGDIDIWCRPESLAAAREVLVGLGYRDVSSSEVRHLAPMVRETGWEWRGDYFAADLPVTVELHYRLWDEQAEFLRAPEEEGPWDRRTTMAVDGRQIPVLSLPDRLTFAALHLLLHLLHGDLPLERAWEIAHFLDTHATDDAFWAAWRRCHTDERRPLEAVIFALVSDWFGANAGEEAEREAEELPDDVKLWMEHYGFAPLEGFFHPGKDEIWLHTALVKRFRDKCAIVARRMLPLRAAARGERGSGQWKGYVRFLGARVVHHARALGPAIGGGVRWFLVSKGLGGGFLRFLAASAFFNLGAFIFFLLYNLYLLSLGFHEDMLGRVAGAATLGTLLGALPAAAIARRLGLRNALLAAILGGAATSFLRTLGTGGVWLVASAFASGLFFSLWAVSYTPAIAGLTGERSRQTAFSVACSFGMFIGIIGGLLGGYLPGLVGGGSVQATRTALIVAAGVVALGALPAAGLRFPPVAIGEARQYPSGRFLLLFLVCLSWWSAAVGAFNPFYNAFFYERFHMSVSRIGAIGAWSRALQVPAVLSAAAILRRLGNVRGIAAMQLMTGLTLAALAFSTTGASAATVYVGFTCFQYMSEPGLFSMLMGRVAAGERSGASALYFLATSLTGAIAAFVAGMAIPRFGYPALLLVAAAMAISAAFLFRTLVQEDARTMTSATSS